MRIKNSIPWLLLICLASGTADCWAADEPPLSAEELAEGWISLFDGQSLYGWRPVAACDWRVEDGTIVVSAGPAGLLRTTTQFADYHLQLEYRAAPAANSGVFLHTSPAPTDPGSECYELNIAPADNPFPTGSLVKRRKHAGAPQDGEWHRFDAVLNNDHVTVLLDGAELYTYVDPRPLGRGYIGLQHNTGKVAFRNIKLRPLGLQSLFNGKDLTGWKAYPEMASRFTVTADGELNVKNGSGQLETAASFGDFVMQLECITHAPELNSGIFFRCIPAAQMMGYECQIHNGYLDGDRNQPADCGTGGIFRRQNAIRVVADDNAWFCQTIIAAGPHMATWVNGRQVCDWTDKRPPDDNPRRGLRLEPGTIMIQGHDPATDISFRHLRAGEMTKRGR